MQAQRSSASPRSRASGSASTRRRTPRATAGCSASGSRGSQRAHRRAAAGSGRARGLDQQRGIAAGTAVGGLEPAAELRLDGTPPPGGLVLEVAEGLEIALSGDDPLDALRSVRPDQLVLEVLDADVGRIP